MGKDTAAASHTRMVLNAYQELLNKTYSLLDEEQILRICDLLEQAERVLYVEEVIPDLPQEK